MIYIKLVDRTRDGADARKYVSFEDHANIATIVCNFALERQISPRQVLCQVYSKSSWNMERAEHLEEFINEI